ncbi:MAG: secondary thiamine-phosphate synthase enzyme YjbQ [Enterobacterales bacterium]|nr:secondary thiamine-phosphate synthase enzyme YjbQ [Enterobacterales bacterium]
MPRRYLSADLFLKLGAECRLEIGLLHLFIQHTSASLAVNENADPSVRIDLENYFSQAVAENQPYFQHNDEGSDDMPAHIKSVLIGCQITLPITQGALSLGTWQGIYLCEHRNHGGPRRLIATLQGD